MSNFSAQYGELSTADHDDDDLIINVDGVCLCFSVLFCLSAEHEMCATTRPVFALIWCTACELFPRHRARACVTTVHNIGHPKSRCLRPSRCCVSPFVLHRGNATHQTLVVRHLLNLFPFPRIHFSDSGLGCRPTSVPRCVCLA